MTTTPTLVRETPTDEVIEERIQPQGFRIADALDLAGAAFVASPSCSTNGSPLSGGLASHWYAAVFVSAGSAQPPGRAQAISSPRRGGNRRNRRLVPLSSSPATRFGPRPERALPHEGSQPGRAAGSASAGGGSAAIVGSLVMVGISAAQRPARHRDRDLPQQDPAACLFPLRMIVGVMSAIPLTRLPGCSSTPVHPLPHQQQTGFAAALRFRFPFLTVRDRRSRCDSARRAVEASLALGGGAGNRAESRAPDARTGLFTAVILGARHRRPPLILTTLGNTSFNANLRRQADARRCSSSASSDSETARPTGPDRALVLLGLVSSCSDRPDHRRARTRAHRPHQAPSTRRGLLDLFEHDRSYGHARNRRRQPSPGGGLTTRDVSAWFANHKVLERDTGMAPNQVTASSGRRLRQVDVPPILNRMQSCPARRSRDCRHRRRRYRRSGFASPTSAGASAWCPEAQPAPGDVGCRERICRARSLGKAPTAMKLKRSSSAACAPASGTRSRTDSVRPAVRSGGQRSACASRALAGARHPVDGRAAPPSSDLSRISKRRSRSHESKSRS